MAPPWAENAVKVVIEFQKGNDGVHRVIKLKHKPGFLPPQLQGRVAPDVWGAFMTEIETLAKEHPYVTRPGVGQYCEWLAGCICIMCIGFGICDPDAGDYNQWLAQLQQLISRYAPSFGQGGAALSLQRVHGNYWVQVDVNPNQLAMGQPVGPYPPPQQAFTPPQGPYPPAPQGYPSQPPQGYPPQGPPGYPPQATAPPQGYPPAPQAYAPYPAAQYPPQYGPK